MILLQTNFNILLACIISLKLLQVLNVFCLVWLSEISDKMVITFHRIFVILLGLSTSATVCHFKVGVCKPNTIYFFFSTRLCRFAALWENIYNSSIHICGHFSFMSGRNRGRTIPGLYFNLATVTKKLDYFISKDNFYFDVKRTRFLGQLP